MDIRTFRAKTMPQALDLVWQELGPDAMVLHTRELYGGLLGRVVMGRQYEIAATSPSSTQKDAAPRSSTPTLRDSQSDPAPPSSVGLASSSSSTATRSTSTPSTSTPACSTAAAAAAAVGYGVAAANARRRLESAPEFDLAPPEPTPTPTTLWTRPTEFAVGDIDLEEAPRLSPSSEAHLLPASTDRRLFEAYAELVESDVEHSLARELVERLRDQPRLAWDRPQAVRARLAHLLEQELPAAGPLQITPGAVRVVALVGPTGVGKTTTIAKLAANYRLRDNLRVGLITVDTYRIAAVEQLRTYADIIDLPLRVAGTLREMREAIDQMQDFDLVLMDTAGRSPRDAVKIRELRALLVASRADEVHLVLSAASGLRNLVAAVDRFAPLHATAALITKLDEATGLGSLLSLARHGGLPISYLTDGQNVPDDICVADPRQLAESILSVSDVPAVSR